MITAVVLVAAGDGTRLRHAGAGLPKALVPLADRSMLEWSLDAVLAADVQSVIVVAPRAAVETVQAMVDAISDVRLAVVGGRSTRQGSVAAGLAATPSDADVVLVHDAARPLTPTSVFDAVRAAVVVRGGGVVPVVAVADTLKQLDDDRVAATIDRSRVAAVQTPQGFPAGELRRAYAEASDEHTDDAALYTAAGGTVSAVAGDECAFKITTPGDLVRAEQLVRPRADAHRIGVGVDTHQFDAEAPLWLGGVLWPAEAGLAGHSDGDVICHAVTDALLAAAHLGDLGSVFGVDRPEEAGRRGVEFVERAVQMLHDAGFRAVNVSVQVLGNRPKLAPRRNEMEQVVGAAARAVVSIAGTTTDGLGSMGRGEGLTAIATALVITERR